MERRKLLSNSIKLIFASKSIVAGTASLVSSTAFSDDETPYPTDPIDIQNWMDEWSGGKKAVSGALHVLRFKNPIYVLTKPITWTPNKGQEKYKAVTVPKGFVTDFASIPRAFWSLLRSDGDYTYPAIVHDYLYWTQERSRKESDMIFRIGMEDFKIDRASIETIYRAVRVGGTFAWSGNNKLKENGERRLLKKFPQNATITWEEWKNIEGVFD